MKRVAGGLQSHSDLSGMMSVIVDQSCATADQRLTQIRETSTDTPNSANPLTMAFSEIPSSAERRSTAAFWALCSPGMLTVSAVAQRREGGSAQSDCTVQRYDSYRVDNPHRVTPIGHHLSGQFWD